VHLNLQTGKPTLTIPVSALIFRAGGLQVGTVVQGPKGSQSKLVNIVLGEDDGRTVEVVSGLDADSQVIQNPPDSLIDGEPVHPVQVPETVPEPAARNSNGNAAHTSAGGGAQ
jgi:hypothetical protein